MANPSDKQSSLWSQFKLTLEQLLGGFQENSALRHCAECGLGVGYNLVQSDITRGGRASAFFVRTCRVGVFVCAMSEEL